MEVLSKLYTENVTYMKYSCIKLFIQKLIRLDLKS
jgi:hypothetical protein